MKRDNGFTLVELLAVISILAILVLISMPQIISLYENARKDIFLNEVRVLLDAAKSKFLSETLKNNHIELVVSDQKYASDGAVLNIEKDNIDFYIALDREGNPERYVVTDGNYSLFSYGDKVDIDIIDVMDKTINIEDYIAHFNIKGPYINSYIVESMDALEFNFKTPDLVKNEDGVYSWSNNGVVGEIVKSNNGSNSVKHYNPIIRGNALILNGPEARAAGYYEAVRFDNYSDASWYKKLTVEATFSMYKFESSETKFTNVISNVNTGGYYLNVNKDGNPGIGLYINNGYQQCQVKNFKLNLNQVYVIAASYDEANGKILVYIDGQYKETCDFPGTLTYPSSLNVPLTIGGNPKPGGFDNTEWLHGEVYTARVYNKVLSSKEIENNYYSNSMIVNGYSENSGILQLYNSNIEQENILVDYYEYSFDNGKTWQKYDPDNKPIIPKTMRVYARTISTLGVISPVSEQLVVVNE